MAFTKKGDSIPIIETERVTLNREAWRRREDFPGAKIRLNSFDAALVVGWAIAEAGIVKQK